MNASIPSQVTTAMESRSRWWAFIILCLGAFMIMIDGTIVNIALPSIKADLAFSNVTLVWVVNAYLITYSGSLLIGGRMGDRFGHRRMFLLGITLFTAASAACGFADSSALLIGARALQGLGGALVAPVALSLTVNLFPEASERAKAMGIYGFVAACAGILGLVLGGTLMHALNWHWIFFINLPLGVVIYALCVRSLPDSSGRAAATRLDIPGATAFTASATLAIYAVVTTNKVGWISLQTVSLLIGAIAGYILFLYIEARAPDPLIPLSLFRRPNLIVANGIFTLWVFTASAWFFVSVLYLQVVLHFRPEQVSMAFVPGAVAGASFSLGISPRVVMRFGIKRPLVTGLLIASIGLAFFARATVQRGMPVDVILGIFLPALGGSIAINPLFLAALNDAAPSESGLVSGILNTAGTMAGALGLAILVSAASARTNHLLTEGASLPAALHSGYCLAFSLGAAFLAVACVLGIVFLCPVLRSAGPT